MPDMDPRRRRESFNTVAELYAAYRLAYPDVVVADVVAQAHIASGRRVLEIGCGTGQLSVPLAASGAQLTAVEMGADLAAIARRNLARFPGVQVEVATFETWPLPESPFDAVVCATAFHWLDPDVRSTKAAQALRSGGVLALVHPHHVLDGNPGFFRDTSRCYVRWGLGDDPLWLPPSPDDLPAMYQELDARPEYASVERHRFDATRRYTTESYIGLLQTDSLILGLDGAPRAGFLADLAELVESHYGGEVSWRTVYEVVLATRR